jgi:hypothetical protein
MRTVAGPGPGPGPGATSNGWVVQRVVRGTGART